MRLKKVKAFKVITHKGDVYETTSLDNVKDAALVKETFTHVEDK